MRKILSFVLVLSLVLGSFSMAFAADTATKATLSDVKGTSYEEAVTVLVDLGVITGFEDGTYKPADTVTRAQAAIIVVKALGMGDAVGNTKSSFTDMSGYGWAEAHIAFANKLGILTGYPDGTFKPGQTVSYNEFATMMVRALGYSDESIPGSWPANYVNKAAALGVMDNIKSAGAAGANRGDVAVMVKNNLGNPIGTVDKDNVWHGTVKEQKKDEDTVYDSLVARLGGKFAKSVIDADTNSLINLVPYMGKYVEYYVNSDDEVIAIAKVKSEEIRGEFDITGNIKLADINDDKITFEGRDGVDYNFRITDKDAQSDPDTFINGESKGFTNKEVSEDRVYTINVKLSGKNITEWYSIIDWKPSADAQVESGDLDDIKDGELLGYDFETTRSGEIMPNSYELVGVDSLSDIKADHVVYVYANNNDDIRRVAVGTEVVKGTIDEADEDDGWKVNGKWYKSAPDVGPSLQGDDYDKEVGNDVELIVDAYGDIYDYDMLTGSAKNYAVVTGGNVGSQQIKLYTQDGSNKVYDTDLSDDWATTGIADIIDTVNALNGAAKGSAAYNTNTAKLQQAGSKTLLVGYDLDKKGQVDSLKTKGNLFVPAGTDKVVLESNRVLNINGTKYAIDSDVVVFAAETRLSNIDKVVKIEDVEKEGKNLAGSLFAAVYNDDNKIAAMIIDTDRSTGGSDDSYAVIDTRTSASNDGTAAWKLSGIADGKALKDVLTTKKTGNLSDLNNIDAIGLFKIDYNSDGHISKAEKLVAGVTNVTVKDNIVVTPTKATKASDKYVVGTVGTHAEDTYGVSDKAVWVKVEMKKNGTTIDKVSVWNNAKIDASTVKEVHMFETNDDKGHDGYDWVLVVMK